MQLTIFKDPTPDSNLVLIAATVPSKIQPILDQRRRQTLSLNGMLPLKEIVQHLSQAKQTIEGISGDTSIIVVEIN